MIYVTFSIHSHLLKMKEQITYYDNDKKMEKCPRARRRAKIYKLLESTYQDKQEPVVCSDTDISTLILSLLDLIK
jgi:hypothetical protein